MMAGFSLTLSHDSLPSGDNLHAYVQAFVSPTWGRPLRSLHMQVDGGKRFPRKLGTIRLEERAAVLAELLVHSDLWQVELSTTGRGSYGTLSIDTQEDRGSRHLTCAGLRSFDVEMLQRGDSWVTAMLDLARAIGVRHGIMTLMNDSGTRSETMFVGISRDGVNQHPFPDQYERMVMPAVRGELGTRYVRFPRWGTIYSKDHVEQLGGVDRIREIVRPALIREFGGDAFYFQLTDSIVTAWTAETMQKQQAFTELVEPLLPPRPQGASADTTAAVPRVVDERSHVMEPAAAVAEPPAAAGSTIADDAKATTAASNTTEAGRTKSRRKPKPFF